jgi:hypothetical protein
MAGSIFLLYRDESIAELRETPYENEDFFQSLIERCPNILAGDQIDPENPRKWILISREIGVPGEKSGANQWFRIHMANRQSFQTGLKPKGGSL